MADEHAPLALAERNRHALATFSPTSLAAREITARCMLRSGQQSPVDWHRVLETRRAVVMSWLA